MTGRLEIEGVYTASYMPGSYHVVATSVADPTVTGMATVTVLPIVLPQ